MFGNIHQLYEEINTRQRERKEPRQKKDEKNQEDGSRRQPNWAKVAEDRLIKAVEERRDLLLKRSNI